ncbi:OmpA family protein [Asticcacaulis solisilvae]|uniref:OmpA family protein n=1 Tax=Asticcacaulis solisilvae TaxID=1217274 RepID=UPI003FD8E50D
MTHSVSTLQMPGWLALGSALLALGACSSIQPNTNIADAQARLSTDYNDKDIADRGQGDLASARTSLQAAQTGWTNGDKEQSGHNLMMGQTYLDLAETRGREAKIEQDNTRLAGLAQLNGKNQQIAAQSQQLDAKDMQLAGKDRQIAGKNDQLADKNQQLAQAQEQLRGYDMTANDLGSTMVLQDVSFETGKSQLLSGGVNRLQPLINYLRLSPNTHVRIEGYTDNVGGMVYNQQLSLDRANAVKAILAAGGVGDDRISTIGSGLDKPVATNDTVAGRQSNRRVEITLLKQPGM